MKRDMFGDPRPKGFEEISEALNENEHSGGEGTYCDIIDGPEDDGQGGYGYSAEVMTDAGSFSTLAYDTIDELVKDLRAAGVDNLIARVFTGAPVLMIGLGALAGGISPFCSCGVIPLIAALLSMGVPLSAVMAFWLASPIMDPSMFVLTAGVLDLEFAVAKTLAAIGLGVFGGGVVHLMMKGGAFADPLREGIGNGGCGGAKIRAPKPVVWRFWSEPERRAKFGKIALSTTLFLAKWLTLAFILESLMLAWIPAETVTAALGGEGLLPIVTATLVGVPAYLNGYAALPLVGGLIEQGMAPGAGMAFLVAGGVTSIPAAMAVWALARPQVFSLYIGLSLTGAFASGLLYQLWHML
ncbi:MAG: permease [Silicimonas sp.]